MFPRRPQREEIRYEAELARDVATDAELRAPALVQVVHHPGERHRDALIRHGLLVPWDGGPTRGESTWRVERAFLPMRGPWRPVPRSTTAEDLAAAVAYEEQQRGWYGDKARR